MKFSLKEIILIGIFAAITAILSQVTINLPYVPITMQTFAVFFTAAVLGRRCGTTSQIIYILIGISGIPVFSNFKAGLQTVLGPTGGYIISFPIIAFITGYMIEKAKQLTRLKLVGIMFVGLIICYVIGVVWLAVVLKVTLIKAFVIGAAPYFPLDIIKIVCASLLAFQVRVSLLKANLLYIHE